MLEFGMQMKLVVSGRVIALRGSKDVYQVTGNSKEQITPCVPSVQREI